MTKGRTLMINENGITSTIEAKALTGGGLSTATKMPCPVYSIPAMECKTGSKLVQVKGSTCESCYALKTKGGWYMKSRVLEPMYSRLMSLKNPQWTDAMVFLIKRSRAAYFRWHDSGDLQGIWHLAKIVEIARRIPDCIFWLPTREWFIVRNYIKNMKQEIPKNLIIRLSAMMVDGPAPVDLARELGVTVSRVSENKGDCPAPFQNHWCRSCRKCWNPKVECVTYWKH